MPNNHATQQTDSKNESKLNIPEHPWSSKQAAILGALNVTQEKGLTSEQVEKRLDQFGANRLRQIERRSTWDILVDQFKSLIIFILIAAAAVSFARQAWVDGGAIVVVLLINTAVGFFTELRATRSIEALQEFEEVESVVRRDGQKRRISAKEIVPGDIVLLASGEIISADLRLLKVSKLQADESTLTGESVPIDKQAEPVEEEAPLAERTSMVFKGTAIARGQGEGVVVASGMETELGEISALVEGAEDEETPLEERLDQLGRKLVWVTLGVAVAVGGAGLLAGRELELMIETAIALAIAAVPEGLPIVATVALARGMWRMLARNALIRRLSSVETLGATNVICTDKTGTLTANQMTVQQLALVSDKLEIELSKGGVEAFRLNGRAANLEEDALLKRALQVAVLCNDAEWKANENGQAENETNSVGDPMEVALLELGAQADIIRPQLIERMPEVERDAFDRETKKMSTIHETDDGYLVAVKGAPGPVLDVCTGLYSENGGSKPLGDDEREHWLAQNREMAQSGLRVLALATKKMDSATGEIYEDLDFLGFVGLLDPPREGVKEAVLRCQEAGIRTIMVTGDQPDTARHIAHAVGLVKETDASVVHGSDFGNPDNSSSERQRILDTDIFARVTPRQKLNLIDLHQGNGSIVAMTGDGINDAPALKSADIGIAMGKRGTQVAREAADMILQDDAFPTIVAAVEQGRVIFQNIRKFVIYLLSGNVGEILAVALATVAAAPLPLLPLQILYLNVLNDAFPALALGVGDGQRTTVMDHPPRDPEESIITRYHWGEIIGYGLLIGVNLLAVFYLAFTWLGLDRTGAVTISFLTLSISRLLHAFNMRDPETGIFDNEITRNPYVWGAIALSFGLLLLAVYWPFLANVLQVTSPDMSGWVLVFGASLVPLIIGQLYLVFFKSKRQQS